MGSDNVIMRLHKKIEQINNIKIAGLVDPPSPYSSSPSRQKVQL